MSKVGNAGVNTGCRSSGVITVVKAHWAVMIVPPIVMRICFVIVVFKIFKIHRSISHSKWLKQFFFDHRFKV